MAERNRHLSQQQWAGIILIAVGVVLAAVGFRPDSFTTPGVYIVMLGIVWLVVASVLSWWNIG